MLQRPYLFPFAESCMSLPACSTAFPAGLLHGTALLVAVARRQRRQCRGEKDNRNRAGVQDALVTAACLRKPRKNLRGCAGAAGLGLGAGFLICGANTAASSQQRWPGSKRSTKRRPSSTITS